MTEYIPPELRDRYAVKVDTAAQALDCDRSTIYRLIDAGDLTKVRIGSSRSMRITVSDLLALLKPQGEAVDADPTPAHGIERP